MGIFEANFEGLKITYSQNCDISSWFVFSSYLFHHYISNFLQALAVISKTAVNVCCLGTTF